MDQNFTRVSELRSGDTTTSCSQPRIAPRSREESWRPPSFLAHVCDEAAELLAALHVLRRATYPWHPRGSAWHIPEPLDVEAMDEAIKHLLGSHDFTTFGTPPNGTGHCIRELTHCSVERIDENYVKIDLKGRSFLYKSEHPLAAEGLCTMHRRFSPLLIRACGEEAVGKKRL